MVDAITYPTLLRKRTVLRPSRVRAVLPPPARCYDDLHAELQALTGVRARRTAEASSFSSPD
jgi:hypothetical protein